MKIDMFMISLARTKTIWFSISRVRTIPLASSGENYAFAFMLVHLYWAAFIYTYIRGCSISRPSPSSFDDTSEKLIHKIGPRGYKRQRKSQFEGLSKTVDLIV